jgi:hypothetical protein
MVSPSGLALEGCHDRYPENFAAEIEWKLSESKERLAFVIRPLACETRPVLCARLSRPATETRWNVSGRVLETVNLQDSEPISQTWDRASPVTWAPKLGGWPLPASKDSNDLAHLCHPSCGNTEHPRNLASPERYCL